MGAGSDRLALLPFAQIAGVETEAVTGLDRIVFTSEMNGSVVSAIAGAVSWTAYKLSEILTILLRHDFVLVEYGVDREYVPAANFVKTQYQIESIDIPSLRLSGPILRAIQSCIVI